MTWCSSVTFTDLVSTLIKRIGIQQEQNIIHNTDIIEMNHKIIFYQIHCIMVSLDWNRRYLTAPTIEGRLTRLTTQHNNTNFNISFIGFIILSYVYISALFSTQSTWNNMHWGETQLTVGIIRALQPQMHCSALRCHNCFDCECEW